MGILEWSPARLQQAGVVFAVVGLSVLSTKPMASNLNMDKRTRILFAVLIGICVAYSFTRMTGIVELLPLISLGLVVLAPAGICFHLFINMLI